MGIKLSAMISNSGVTLVIITVFSELIEVMDHGFETCNFSEIQGSLA